jgi:uncharacterized membrane protein
MSVEHVKWLLSELPALVGKGILSADGAEALRLHYGLDAQKGARSLGLILLSVLGALLIGAGVILLLAHNWSDLSRSVRTALSFLPLAACLAWAGWRFIAGRDGLGEKETLGVLWSISVAASIALVGQTYHIPGDLRQFLMTWMLLCLPVIYLTGSVAALCVYLAGVTGWVIHAGVSNMPTWLYWVLLLAGVPLVVRNLRSGGAGALWAPWVFAVSLPLGLGFALHALPDGLWTIVFAGLFASYLLAGELVSGTATGLWSRPLQVCGSIGVAVLALLLTYEFPWEVRSFSFQDTDVPWAIFATAALFPMAAVVLAVQSLRRPRLDRILAGGMPILAVAAYAISAMSDAEFPAQIAFNSFLLAWGLAALWQGVREGSLRGINGGMFSVAMLVVARFFDSDLGFVARGVAFVALGAVFLGINLFMVKRGGAR